MTPDTFDSGAENILVRSLLRKHFEDLAGRSANIDLAADSQLLAVETVRALAPLMNAYRQVALEAFEQLGLTASLERLRSTAYTATGDTGDIFRFNVRAGVGSGEWSGTPPEGCLAAVAAVADELREASLAMQPCEWVRFTARKIGANWHATFEVQLARDDSQPQATVTELLARSSLRGV